MLLQRATIYSSGIILLGCDAAFAVMQTKSLHQLQEHYLSDRFGKTHAKPQKRLLTV